MFENVGGKIKKFAVASFWVDAIAGIIGGISIISNEADDWLLGIAVMFGSIYIAWILSLFLYGFGQLIENSDKIANNTNKLLKETQEQSSSKEIAPIEDETVENKPIELKKPVAPPAVHCWRCDRCGNMVFDDTCPHCGV